jgi:hypothetical protein
MPRVQELLGEIFESEENVEVKMKVSEVIGMIDVITAAVNNDTKKLEAWFAEAKFEDVKKPLKLVKKGW